MSINRLTPIRNAMSSRIVKHRQLQITMLTPNILSHSMVSIRFRPNCILWTTFIFINPQRNIATKEELAVLSRETVISIELHLCIGCDITCEEGMAFQNIHTFGDLRMPASEALETAALIRLRWSKFKLKCENEHIVFLKIPTADDHWGLFTNLV